jgi:hypothetical protein
MKYKRTPIQLIEPSEAHKKAYEELVKAFLPAQDAPFRVWEDWTRENYEENLKYTRLQQEKWDEIGRKLEEEQNEETDNT